MTEAGALAFAERLKNDEAFRIALCQAPDAAARRAMAAEAGYDIGPEDQAAVDAALGIEPLSDDDLDRVDGVAGEESPVGPFGTSISNVAGNIS